jgi:PAS domain S-box-containing protein
LCSTHILRLSIQINILGVSKNRLRNCELSSFVSNDSQDELFLHLKNAIQEPENNNSCEIKFKSINDDLYFRIKSNSYSENNSVFIRCTMNNISELKQTQDLLIDSEEKFSKAFDLSPDSVTLSILENGIFVEVNKGFLKLSGFKYEDVIGYSSISEELNIWVDPNQRNEFIKLLMKQNEVNNFEFMARNYSGEILYALASARIIEIKGKPYILAITRDITSKVLADKELNLINNRLEVAMDAGRIAWWEMELPSGNVKFNSRKVEMLGLNPEDFKHYDDFTSLVHPDDYNSMMNSMLDHINGKADIYQSDYRIRKKDGSYLWFKDIGRITETIPEHGYIKLTGVVIDINDRKLAEISIQESERIAREANSAKDKFFSIIAHDLRSPFTGFIGLSELLMDDYEVLTHQELKDISKTIHNSANSLFGLLNDLLMWSRSQIGSIPFDLEELDLYELVFNNIYILRSSSMSKGISIINNVEKNTIVNCDRNMILTVIRNLISNSIKFTNINGLIEIGIICTDNPKEVCIYVKDNGVGMSETIISEIFQIDKFTTTHGTNNEKGSGLGLLLCKEFISKHGGRIWVESTLGLGTTFFFTLPK